MNIRSILFYTTAIVVVPFCIPGLMMFLRLMFYHGECFWREVFGGM